MTSRPTWTRSSPHTPGQTRRGRPSTSWRARSTTRPLSSDAQQQVADATGDRDAQQGVVDIAAGAVVSKQGEIAAKQAEIDTASDAIDALLSQELTGVTATHVGGNVWEADVSGLDDGTLAVQAAVTDAAGNTATAGDSFTLDTSADLGDAFTVSVAADDQVTNLAESTDVSLSLAGIDGDAASVSVEISDGTNTVNADATNDGSGWVVADQDLSGLADGALTVSATVTDQAGNSALAVSASLTLDTSADLGDAFTVSVAADDQVTNAAESTDVSLSLSGIDGDAASVSVEISDGTNTVNADATNDGSGWVVADQDLSGLADGALTVSATVTDQAGNSAPAVTASLTLDTSADLGDAFTVSVAADDQVTNAAESTDVSLSLAGIDGDAASVSVEITDGTNTVNADATNDGSGWVVADQDLSGLADGALTVSATVTDQAGNSAPAVSASLTLDTSADLGDAFTVSVAADDQVTECS